MFLVDTHSHICDDRFNSDRKELIENLENNGIKFIVEIGCDYESSKEALELSYKHKNIFSVIGVHPHDVKDMNESLFEKLESLAGFDRCVGIGEIGLDYFRNLSPKDLQEKWFRRQLELAKKMNKPIVLHIRDAYKESFEILKDYYPFPDGGVFHCFSSDYSSAKKAIEMGFKIGIGGTLTYKKNEQLREVVKRIPVESIVTETDCPYLSPEPLRGKRNEPSYVKYVVELIANLKNTDIKKISDKLFGNALELYKTSEKDI